MSLKKEGDFHFFIPGTNYLAICR